MSTIGPTPRCRASSRLLPAHIVVSHSLASLMALRRGVALSFLVAVLVTGLIALLLASWLSTRINRPLTALAAKTADVDMDRLDVAFDSDRSDEIGALSRLLGAMTERLRAGAARLREAERRLAMGDLARQVNHDIKNGLIPIRNVFRHLGQAAGETPDRLAAAFRDRQGTVESSISYLENLASNYARLYPQPARESCDVNAVVRETVKRVGETGQANLRLELAEGLGPVRTDPLVLRRILENLIGNAIDSLAARAGSVTVSTGANGAAGVRITVADTGKGMTQEELNLLGREGVAGLTADLERPGMEGSEVRGALQRRGSRIPVLVSTGTGNYDRCTEAIRLGARSFIDKAEPMERVVQEVEHALEQQRLAGQLAALRSRLDSEAPLVGASPAMQALKDAIGRVAKIPSPVLIVGESGSGKELVARELHRLGANPAGQFIALNAAAIPENLVEDELFGHERGAFTGAGALRKGAFEAASGGTLFLDEIGELPPAAQAKLLRVIEQRQITRLGGNRTVAVTARVVAATNRDLDAEVQAGRLSPDLPYCHQARSPRPPP